MELSDSLKVNDTPALEVRRRGTGPALGLIFVAPLVAEFLLGNLPIKLLPALMVLAPMYGAGALLIREMVRRTGRGWPSILLLGMAYGIFEEAFTTQSLFNPNYLKLILGAAALVFASAAMLVPMHWGWGAVVALLGLDAGMLAVVVFWQRMGAMTLLHQLALGAGAALAYGWHAFLQHPAVGGLGPSVRVGNAIFLAGAIGLVWFGVRRISGAEQQRVHP